MMEINFSHGFMINKRIRQKTRKISLYSYQKESGFSLLEVMLYVSIFAIILIGLTIFSIDLIKSKNKANIKRETQENARIVFDQLAQEARWANTYDSVQSTPSQLVINTRSGTARFYRAIPAGENNNAVYIEVNGISSQITNDDVDVTAMTFSVADISDPGIWVSITVEDNSPISKAEFQSTETFRTYINLRSNSKPAS